MSSFRFVARLFATEFRRLFTTSPLPSSQLRDQLRWTIDGSAEAFCTSMIIRDSIAESLQMTRTVSLKGWSLDQLMTSDLQDFLAALGEYSKSMAHLSGSQLIDQLRRALRVSDEVFHSPKANARSFSDSVQVMKSTSPLTGALDRLRPSYPQGIMAALGEKSISRMTFLAGSPVMDQLRNMHGTVAPASAPPMAVAKSIADSVQVMKSISSLTGALDRLRPSYPQGIMASLRDNSISRMASLAGSPVTDQLRNMHGTVAAACAPPMAVAKSISDSVQVMKSTSSLTGALDRLRPSYPQGIMAALRENSISRMAAIGRSPHLYPVSRFPYVSTHGRIAETIEDTALVDSPSVSREDEFPYSSRLQVCVPSRPTSFRPDHYDNSVQVIPKIVQWETERALRSFLEQRLRAMYGDMWLERSVPRRILKRWMSRQTKDQQEGRLDTSLVDYSDFMDLFCVITEPRNWEESFESFFGDVDDISVSFRRLSPIRNCIAHNRQLSEEDRITLFFEAHRILGRLGRSILSLS